MTPGAAPPAPATTAVVSHLFRHEAGRVAAAVVRLLGLGNLDLVEDVVQDVLLQALEVWKFGGVPDNPAAWLTRAAKNRAIDVIRCQRTQRRFAPELSEQLATEWSMVKAVEGAFLEREIGGGELRLMFSLCDGRLPQDTQMLVVLKYLCGFGVRELAQAFLSSEDAIEKRLGRARTTLQACGLVEIGDEARVRARLPAVCQALYLLFNEGYHGSHPENVVREELCAEALRLCDRLASHPVTGLPEVHALLALMCLLAARLPARRNQAGDLVPLEEQDRGTWDRVLQERGFAALAAAAPDLATGGVSELHIEAAITAVHANAASFAATDWATIVGLYDQLYQLRPTPVVALNRAVAVGQAQGPAAGLLALGAIAAAEKLDDYVFFAAARADMLRRGGRPAEAIPHYQRAQELARSEPERRFFARRLGECEAAPEGGHKVPR